MDSDVISEKNSSCTYSINIETDSLFNKLLSVRCNEKVT